MRKYRVPKPTDLRACRILSQVSVSEAAAIVGVEQPTLTNWEQSVHPMPLTAAYELAQHYPHTSTLEAPVPSVEDMRSVRLAAGVSVAEAADHIGIDYTALSHAEAGDHKLRLPRARALLDYYREQDTQVTLAECL